MAIHDLDGIAPELPGQGKAWVAPTASVIGRVTLGEGVGVWFGSVIRGDNERIAIGRDTNVQECCVFHTDMGYPATVGAGCTIGHRAIVHGCTVGDNVLIGMGATIMNGVRIGNDCIVGAGALIPEGREIPAGSLVIGMPGKIVRPLTPQEIEGNRVSARHYVANWQRFAKGLGPAR